MTNNDVLRRVRYCFDFSDDKVMALFALGGAQVSRDDISRWLKREEDADYKSCADIMLATFLNGLIVDLRGPKPDGQVPAPESRLTNNSIFMKLKIALNLKAEEVLAILDLADFSLSKHELSALFRKPEHKHYRECKDQILRNFLLGMQLKYRTLAQ